MSDLKLSLNAARTLALHTQNLAAPPAASLTLDTIYETVKRLTCVQIDTLQMVNRSHYLVLYSRLGAYAPADFDRLVYDPSQRRLFEYWAHAASFIPLDDFRYRLPTKRWFRESEQAWRSKWLADPKNREVMEGVMTRIRQDGALRAANFEDKNHRGGTWWNWKPAKTALEVLYNRGELMIADRVNFQRVYDLPEQVLPDWVNITEPTSEEADRYHVEQALRAIGVSQPLQVAEYAYMKRTTVGQVMKQLVVDGTAIPVQAEFTDGDYHPAVIHRDNLALAQQAADGQLTAAHTTFLSPFDSLFWARGRDQQLWNFRQRLEAYTPAEKREWGYFSLPILHRDRLVGRFDPKLERKARRLRLKALHLEPGIAPDERLVHDTAGALGAFMRWHNADDLVIEQSNPPEFGEKLLRQIRFP